MPSGLRPHLTSRSSHAEPARDDTTLLEAHLAARRASARRHTPRPQPTSACRRRPPHGSPSPASTPPAGRHSCRHGQTARENDAPGTALHMRIACVGVFARPRHQPPNRRRRTGPRAVARRGRWVAPWRPCPNAYLRRTRDQSRGPSLPARCSARRSSATTTPSDSRCAPLAFAIGLYERSLLTRLRRRASPVPRSDLARVQVSVPRRDPPHPIRNQDWRTWPSP